MYEVVPTARGPVVRRDLHDVEFVAPDARGALVPSEAPIEPDQELVRFTEAVRAMSAGGAPADSVIHSLKPATFGTPKRTC